MSAKPATAHIIELQQSVQNPVFETASPVRGKLLEIKDDGTLLVDSNGHEYPCDWLEGVANANIHLELGDQLLFIPSTEQELGVVLGRIGRYHNPQPQEHITIEASESLTLKCGEALIELRSDGKAMLRGEDLLLRAKGTQRIRAGTVAIN
jgi:hypothetical protein